jgi:hypothetical protein
LLSYSIHKHNNYLCTLTLFKFSGTKESESKKIDDSLASTTNERTNYLQYLEGRSANRNTNLNNFFTREDDQQIEMLETIHETSNLVITNNIIPAVSLRNPQLNINPNMFVSVSESISVIENNRIFNELNQNLISTNRLLENNHMESLSFTRELYNGISSQLNLNNRRMELLQQTVVNSTNQRMVELDPVT